MFSTWWPLLLVVASSVGYQVGLKEVSDIGDPMASLTVTYLAASVVSFVIYFFQSLRKESFLRGVLSVNASAIGWDSRSSASRWGRSSCTGPAGR